VNRESPPARACARSSADSWLLALGLSLTPCAVAIAAYALPHVHVDANPTNVIAFAGATLFPIIGLSLAAKATATRAVTFAVTALAAALLLAIALRQPSPLATVLCVDSALVGLAWALGCSLGRRVQHESHLFPACVVAASADLASVLAPEGPSHAIAESERALSLLATWFPVPGSAALAPALGLGDLLFMGLTFGIARAHGLPYARCVITCAIGTALAGAAAAWSGLPIPALVPIAALLVLTLPAIRRLRRNERKAAHWSMLIAGSVALATIARTLFSHD